MLLFEARIRGTVDGVVLNKFFQTGPLSAAQAPELHTESSNKIGYFCIGNGREFSTPQIKTAFKQKNVQHTGLIQPLQAMDIPK